MSLPPLRWCRQCRREFRPVNIGHVFCSRRCRRRNARARQLEPDAAELEKALVAAAHLLRAGGPVPATQDALARVRRLQDAYERRRGKPVDNGCVVGESSDDGRPP